MAQQLGKTKVWPIVIWTVTIELPRQELTKREGHLTLLLTGVLRMQSIVARRVSIGNVKAAGRFTSDPFRMHTVKVCPARSTPAFGVYRFFFGKHTENWVKF